MIKRKEEATIAAREEIKAGTLREMQLQSEVSDDEDCDDDYEDGVHILIMKKMMMMLTMMTIGGEGADRTAHHPGQPCHCQPARG